MKFRVLFFLISAAVTLPFIVEATSFTSTTTGNWNDGGTWGNTSPGVEGTDWPSSTDDVTIFAGHTITLTADRIINSIDVQSSGILTMSGNKLTVNGNFNCDGSITGTADLLMYGRSIGGSGTVTLTGKKFKIYTDVTVIEPGSTLTISDEIKIETDDIDIINYGTLTVLGKIIKKNDGNIWINEANSVVNVSKQFMDNNLIEASAVPNTINFNGTGAQKVFTPVSSYHHVQFTDIGTKELQGDVDINGDVTISTAELDTKNRNITLAGNWINNGTFTQGTGTVTFDGTSTISGSTTTTFYNVVITGSLTGHATNMNVSGNWTDNGTYTHNSGNVSFTGSTTQGGSSTTSFCGVTITGILIGHPTNMNVDCNWINNGTFNHNSGKVTFIGTSTLSGSSTTSFYDITITGSLTGVSSGNFNVAGDWDNNGGTFADNSGTVTFNGATASTISNTGSGNFNNLTINNATTSDAVTLNNSITVDGTITFTDGHVVSSSSSPLIIETSGVVSGVSDASYVDGPVSKNTNSTANFVFPVGDDNSYRPIEVTPTSTDATTFTGRYYRANQSLGSGLGAGIDHISTAEYWEMERSAGTANADVILTWDANSQVDNLTELRVAQFDNTNWINKGNDGTTGAPAAGTITINAVSSFTTKNFTLASSTTNNPLSNDRYTVVASGNWTDASTWAYSSGGAPGASVPTASQNAIIEGGATISLTAETSINNLEIKSGNTVNGGGNRLNIYGDLIVDGDYGSIGDIDYYGTSITGSGTITLTGKALKLKTDGMIIEPGAVLTLTANELKIDVNDIDVTNYGTLTVTGNIKEQNGGNIWINEANSALNVTGQFMADDQIEASARPNTINFNGTGNQDVFKPVSSYHHIQLTGGGIKTLKQDTDINGDVTITTANFNSNNKNITLAGNLINNGTFTEGTGTVTFDGTSTISGSTTTTFYNVVITGSLTGHATDMNVSGDWTNNGTYTHNSGNVSFTGSTTLGGSSTTSFCGVTITGILTGHPTNMNVSCNWINNGTFNHNSGKVTFTGTSTLSGSSTSSFYDITITGALTGVSSGNFNVAGDWDNNGGTFASNIGTVTFNGTTASTISNTGSGNFNNLTINNSAATDAVTLNNSITVDGTITFTDGHVVSSSSSPLIIETSGVVSGVSDASYVQGPVAKNTNSTANFVFPVGDDNSYRPIEVTPNSTDATTFTGRYYRAAQALGSGLGAGLDHISYSEYWEMERSSGTANADVILTWDASSQVDNLTDLRVAQFDGSNWIDKGNGVPTGTTTAGTITINAVSSFTTKNFTLASSTANNPLSNDRYTVVSSGNWTDASTWAYTSGGTPGASVPTASQNAVIEGGATIALTAETSINNLEIKSGNIVNGGGSRLNIYGDLIVDGDYGSTGDIDYYGTSISGSGTITLTGKALKLKTDGTVIEPGADLTLTANELKIDVNDIDVSNYGTLTVTGNIKEQNGGNIWINEVNSVLNVSGQFMADDQIEASATPNMINFNGTGNQDFFRPVSSYHHVQLTGGGIKTLKQDTDIDGDVTITTANFNSNNKNITLAGNWINDGTFAQGTGTVTFDGTSTISGSTTTTFYNVVITGSLTGDATDMNVSGDWTDNGTYTHNSGNVTFTGSTTLDGSSTTSFCGVTITGILTGHPTNMNVSCDWINNGTFNHNSGKVTFTGTSTLSGSSTSSFYDIAITGALTGVSSGNFNVAGDWDNNAGTFTSNSGTVTFNGASTSVISNTGSGSFNNLTINNSAATDAVTLNNSITVDGTITFTDGHVVSSSSSPLIIETSGVVSGVSDASYVQGPVAKNTNSTANFVFPVGDDNSYRPIEVTPNSTDATTFTGRYYRAAQALGSGLGAGLDHISYSEYWEMERSAGTANADVILTWDASSQVDNLTDLRVAQFDGSNWIDKGNDGTAGTTTDGTITINAVSSFTTKNFTLASSTANNPLSMDRYTVVASGIWTVASTWAYTSGGPPGASVPTASQNAIIEGGANITLPANQEINNLEIKTGNTLNGVGGATFTIHGDLIVDGAYSSTGDIVYFGTSIDGSGTITLTGKALKLKTDGTVIEPGADLTLTANELKIDENDIDVTNYGTLTVTGDIKRQNGGNIWTNAANSVLNVGGDLMEDNQIEASAVPNIINFNGTGDQDVHPPVSSYYNVQFSVGGTKNLRENTDINGDVTITTAEFKANNRDITLAGNWINDGTFTQGTGTVTFDGTSTISGSTTTTFYDLVVNTSGGVLLSKNVNVEGALTMTNGIMATDNTNILTIEDGGTSNDGFANSFVDGPMKKIGDTDFTFPVGDGSAWAPVMVSSIAGASATTELTGEYFFAMPPNRSELPIDGISYLSEVEYWEVDNNTADVTSAEITLFWKDAERSLISDIVNGLTEDLIAAHYNASTPEWEALNSLITIGSTTGPGGTGSVKATTTSFSPFTFASAFGNNPLPIELTYFTGIAQEDVVMLKWETASEQNNDFFTIEHSPDGEDFYELAQIPGSGTTSTVNTYSYVDEHPFYGLSYYRLKQTDFDGKFEYSNIIAVQVLSEGDPNEIDFEMYPNPTSSGKFMIKSSGLSLKNEKFQVVIRDHLGRMITSQVFLRENYSKFSIDLDLGIAAKPGIYIVTINIQDTRVYKKLIVE